MGWKNTKSGLIQKIEKKLNECSSHFFVNEGLMNEVRIEKEKNSKGIGFSRRTYEQSRSGKRP